LKKILTILFIFISCLGFSQQKKIKFDADLQFADEEKYPGATVLIGKVKMIHAGAVLTSKKAFYYKEDNFFKAIGDVVINQGDTIKQYSDYVDYDADTKKTVSWGHVILKDPTMTLTTDTLYFNRASQLLFYKDNAVIKDETNVLKSKFGNYYLEQKKFVATTKGYYHKS
jgi:lipopolysaccharide assembly outer membrane protein LptD (OstA)